MRAARVLGFGLVVAAAGACSLITDSSKAQCDTDADCYGRGGDFSASVCAAGRCVSPEGAAPDGGLCATNKECADKLQAPALCRTSDHLCTRILSPECTIINGDSTDDNAIFIGELNSVTGTNGPSGIARQNAGDLALNQIKASVGGIRATPTSAARPIVLVECDDGVSDITPATHLVNDLEVPAIIGVASSSNVIDVATQLTIKGHTLLISPEATSTAITSLADNNLVWRTAPSDAIQALALIDQLPAVEAEYRTLNSVLPTTKVRIAFVYVDESYGQGLYGAVTSGGQLNGKPLGDSSNNGLIDPLTYPPMPTDMEAQIENILAQDPRPNIVVGFGSTEMVTEFLGPLESRWGTASPKPVYLFADAVEKTELLTLVTSNDDLRKRVRGTVPAAPASWPNFQSFVFGYQGAYGSPVPSVFGMAGTYDSVFLIGYAIAAAGASPLTGETLAAGFSKLVSGAKINAGGTNMNAGLAALVSPGMFNFEGASGPLDFDLTTGEAPSNIDVWCIQKNGGAGVPAFVPSGRDYDPVLGMMTGTYDLKTCQGAAAD